MALDSVVGSRPARRRTGSQRILVAEDDVQTREQVVDAFVEDDHEVFGLESGDDSPGLVVAYHAACSLQHGQRITRQPKELLTKLGFAVRDVPEGHLCCGSAGTYNILQPNIARRLRDRKVGTIERMRPDVIAAGNIGCITQFAAGTELPAVHTVELIDWATGGPCPPTLRERRPRAAMGPATAAD